MSNPVAGGLATNLRRLLQVFLGEMSSRGGDAEVAVVLGSQVLPGGRPSGTLMARTLHAARLYAGGRVRLIIPTGGVGRHPPSEAEIMARILREAGVPREAVLPEGGAMSTWDSARFVSRMMRDLGVERVLVVTDPLHCVRTVAAFRQAGLEALPEPVYSSPMWRNRWLRLGQFARETGALAWYKAKHGVGSPSRR
ncbi:hypothetical protein RxyAA322_05680 [Rubrobacter xylanophilus]|uniref:DUF218 domain-containing protein n=1 Tax=Rubrobacter xylanophilus TaxID=49319 RepID=A0A510HFJ8_9ACTN|nr:YdcF family protein [Rubrobacter xylanophilus]BBL78714.1 hypothetical protein RxyAA322_05680 [Rubrobacter xylanophilus]